QARPAREGARHPLSRRADLRTDGGSHGNERQSRRRHVASRQEETVGADGEGGAAMNDDELKQLWQEQPLREPDVSPAQLIAALQDKTTRLRGTLDARDLRELVGCASMIVVFGVFYFTVYVTPVSRVGDLIIIGSLIFIGWKLVYTRRST